MTKYTKRRFTAFVITAVMMFSTLAATPLNAYTTHEAVLATPTDMDAGTETPPGTSASCTYSYQSVVNEIISFEPLPYYIAEQTVPHGTEPCQFNLPPALMAAVRSMPNAATPTDAPVVTDMYVPVTWVMYDGDTPGLYIFYALAEDGFVFTGAPPVIRVTVEAGGAAAVMPLNIPAPGTITGTVRPDAAAGGIANVLVELIHFETGVRVSTTTTDAYGVYEFIGVPNGLYRLVFSMTGHAARITLISLDDIGRIADINNFTPGTSGVIYGNVRRSETDAGVFGAFVTLINIETGGRVSTRAFDAGGFTFSDVQNGTYRLVFTYRNFNARISEAFVVSYNGAMVHETDFTAVGSPLTNNRVLIVRLTGLPIPNPTGTTVTIQHRNQAVTPLSYGGGGLWYIFLGDSAGHGNISDGVGIVTASVPGFNDVTRELASGTYLNNVGFITLDFGRTSIFLSVTSGSLLFGSRLYGEGVPLATVTVTNNGVQDVMMDNLPHVPNWTLIPSWDWNLPMAPGSSRTFQVRPNTRLPEGTYDTTIRITGIGASGVFVESAIMPRFSVYGGPGTITGSVTSVLAGGILVGGHVALINTETGERLNTQTDERGVFIFNGIPNGSYLLVYTKDSFAGNAVVSNTFVVNNNARRMATAHLTMPNAQHNTPGVLLVHLTDLPRLNGQGG